MKSEKLMNAIGLIKDEYIDEAHNRSRKGFTVPWALLGKIAAVGVCLLLVINILPSFFRKANSGGSYYNEYASDYREDGYAYDEEASAAYNYEMKEDAASPQDNLSDVVQNQNKKLILTASLKMETQEFDDTLAALKEKVNVYGGYMQSSAVSSRSNGSRYYTATIRVPAEKYQEFLASLDAAGHTVSYTEEVKDVTDSYTDISARLSSLKAQEAKVLEFYDKAESIEDLMSVEARLSEIRYEIEYYEAQIKNYDLLVAYSTLNITIDETRTYTPVSQSFWTRLANSFRNGWYDFTSSIGDLFIDLVYNIWTIITIVLLVILGVFIYRRIKARKNR